MSSTSSKIDLLTILRRRDHEIAELKQQVQELERQLAHTSSPQFCYRCSETLDGFPDTELNNGESSPTSSVYNVSFSTPLQTQKSTDNVSLMFTDTFSPMKSFSPSRATRPSCPTISPTTIRKEPTDVKPCPNPTPVLHSPCKSEPLPRPSKSFYNSR
ncbi:hypothetical protein P9112_009653 [Eukaryota sp. TZLM1-RC]